MKQKIILMFALVAFGLTVIIGIRLGYIASISMRITLGLLAAWALGNALKILVESRKKD